MTDSLILPSTQTQQTMSSREIAELTGVRHDNAMRTLNSLNDAGLLQHPQIEDVKNDRQQSVKQYRLNYRDSLVLAARLSPLFMAKVVDRWQELETQQAPTAALPSPTDLAWMVIKAEEDKEAALAEAKRLNEVCNTVTRQFVEGETPARFCMQLNGVNTNQVQKWLASRGHLIDEGSKGYRPSCHTRDVYFKLQTIEKKGREFYQCYLTNKGCRWLYSKYLKHELPMKASWNGELNHGLFNQPMIESNVAYLPVRAVASHHSA